MSGAIKINLFNRAEDPTLWEHAEKFEGETGKYYVFAHGSPDSISDDRNGKGSRSVRMTALDLAKMLEDAGATPDNKVFLHSCSTGQGVHSFARELSHYFVEVEGATRNLRDSFSKDESEFRHTSVISGKGVPGVFATESTESAIAGRGSDPGRMKQFHAADYQLSIIHPALVDSAATELPAKGPRNWIEHKDGITQYMSGNSRRDLGDEQPIIASMPNAEKSQPIRPSEIALMAKEYIAAISKGTDDAREQAGVKYPDLKMAFSYHDKMMGHATNVSNPAIVEKGLNQHIVLTILEGKFAALQSSEQHMARH
jgi:hypothetical protein